jgi:hypothetical protein
VAHFDNQDVVLYFYREDGGGLVEIPESRINLQFSNSEYAFDVEYSDLKALAESTNVSVLISPNLDSNNVLTQWDVTSGKDVSGNDIFALTKV